MTSRVRGVAMAGAALLLTPLAPGVLAAVSGGPGSAVTPRVLPSAPLVLASASGVLRACPAAPDYYAFELGPTGKVPAVADAEGRVEVGSPASPFALAVTRDGRVTRRLEVSLDAPPPARGVYVAWAADPELATVVRLGTIGRDRTATGDVALNKLLVFVTLEPDDDPGADRWSGPVALVGRSRSARIQSMASHGSFETESC